MEYIYIIIRNAFYFYFERSHLEMIFDIESSVDPYFNIWISISKYSSTWDKIKNLLFSKLMESFDIYIYIIENDIKWEIKYEEISKI